MTVVCLDHVHDLSSNPLSFPRHRQALEEWQALIQTARKHREAVIPYSESRRVLESEEFGITISAREYYNSVRKMIANKDQPQTIDGLLVALQEEGFVYRVRVKVEEDDDGKPVKRKMLQLWFAHREQLDAATRFCSDWLLVIDGTFNTNKERLPLLIAVGVLNSGKTFPVSFSYCPSESAESFAFVWDSLKEECFRPDGNLPAPPYPRIFLGDQAGGLLSSVPKAFPDALVQSCDWHAVEAMKEKFRKSGYRKDEIDGEFKNGEKVNTGLADIAWQYVKSMSIDELEVSRQLLLDSLRPGDRQYIIDTWKPKEKRVIWCYTKFYPNLGSTSSQRGESYHPVMREITNGQLSIEQSAKRLAKKVLSILKEISTDEDLPLRKYPRAAQLRGVAFEHLRAQVSNEAITLLEKEWQELLQAMSAGDDLGKYKSLRSPSFILLIRV
jgi:hypothetical protein